VQQHQSQQPVHLGLVGHELRQQPSQPDRLGSKIAAVGVALVEDQVDHRQHRRQAVRQHRAGRHRKRDPGRLDLELGPGEPALHRLLRHEEGAGNLSGGEAAQGP